jgi:hypothetical protein
MTISPELKLFRAIITQAIEDAMYNGIERYKVMDKRESIAWLTSNSNDFQSICNSADIDPEYAIIKFTKAMNLHMYKITDSQYRVIQNKPGRPHKSPGSYRLKF